MCRTKILRVKNGVDGKGCCCCMALLTNRLRAIQVCCPRSRKLPALPPHSCHMVDHNHHSRLRMVNSVVHGSWKSWCDVSCQRWCGPKPSPTKERRNVVNSFPDNLHDDKPSPVSGNGLIKMWNYGEFCFIVLRHSPVMLSKYQQPLICLCVTKSAVFHFTLAPSKFTYVLHIDSWQNQRSDL